MILGFNEVRIKVGTRIETKLPDFYLRFATEQDVDTVLDFIKHIADYEKMSDQVQVTREILHQSLFVRHAAEAILAYEGDTVVGFAVFFENFSTFTGKPGLYLEDLFVLPEYRGKGYGKALLCFLAQLAVERACARMEWTCLNWNTPSLQFYQTLDARTMDEWTVHRLTGGTLERAAAQFPGK